VADLKVHAPQNISVTHMLICFTDFFFNFCGAATEFLLSVAYVDDVGIILRVTKVMLPRTAQPGGP
jgi:hypothetical protein